MMSGIVHIYKERQSWVVDTGGTKEHPGANRERAGYGDFPHAVTHAVNIADQWRLRNPGMVARARRVDLYATR